MKNIIEHKGYFGSVEYEDHVLFGKIININSLVNYEAESVKELESEFKEAVEDYLQTCEETGIEPEKPYNGKIAFRTTPDLHKKAFVVATSQGVSLNKFLENCVSKELKYI